MATILAAGTTEAASSTFVLTAGQAATIYLTDAAGPGLPFDACADVQIASAGSQYFTVGTLTRSNPAVVLEAAGTFRVLRHACETAVAIEQN